MAAKAWATRGLQQNGGVEEIFVQTEDVSLCLLVNRRAKTMRIVDFRAGASEAKKRSVAALAIREGAEKVYTLVERDEAAAWVKLGFTKEGSIPGFYKRSDAFLLGMVTGPGAQFDETPAESGVRIAIPGGGRTDAPWSPAHDEMERTIVLAKKFAKDLAHDNGALVPSTKLAELRESDARKAVLAALKSGRARTAFEPFGRGVAREYYVATARNGFELVALTESQSWFGNSFLELLTSPQNDTERGLFASAIRAISDKLLSSGVVSCFALTPSDDIAIATALVFNGFRRTGLLLRHLPAHVSPGGEACGGRKNADCLVPQVGRCRRRIGRRAAAPPRRPAAPPPRRLVQRASLRPCGN